MSRIQSTFDQANAKKILIPFITAGDPDLKITLSVMHSMVENGADIIELGVPFSDPMADGPTIQKASERALKNNVSIKDILALVKEFRQTDNRTPIVLMGYLNPILKMGKASFAQLASEAGVDGVLTVDCPAEEIDSLQQHLHEVDIDCIFLIAPTTTETRAQQIIKKASGFLYYVSLTGVTGAASLNTEKVAQKIAELKTQTSLPIVAGFGIKDAQSAAAIAKTADGVVVGSRLVQTIEENPGQEASTVGLLIKNIKEAI